ncbi:MAG TPA: MFS transporter [Streptosporangiaceae bacterium]
MTGRAAGGRDAGGVLLLALATQQLLMAYDSTAMNVAISDIVADLHTTLTGVQSAISVYALVMAALMITGSKLGTLHGHTRMFTLGAVIYGTGALITSLSPDLPVMLFGWSLLEGVGAALIFPAIFSIATTAYTGARRTRALAMVGAATGVGAALGPILCGLISTYLTWRVSFFMETLVTAAVIVLMRRALEPRRAWPAESFDLVGVTLSALGFGLIVFATLLIGRYGFLLARKDVVAFGHTVLDEGDVAPTPVLAAAGLAVLVLFAWWERQRIRRGRDPLVRLAVLRNRTTRVGSEALAAQFLVTAGVLFLVPVFVQTTLDYDALESGLTLLPTTLALIVAAAIASRLVGAGRVGRKPLIVAGFLLIAAGSVVVAFTFDPDGSGLRLAPGLAVAGLGLGLCAILPDLVQSSATEDAVSDVAGLSRSASYLGQSVGVALAGALMVGVLVDSFGSGVRASAILGTDQKAAVQRTLDTQVQATAVSDGQLAAALRGRGVTGTAAADLVQINATARERGLTAAVLAMGLFALIGCGLALRLPRLR